jgi:biotin synthase
MFEELGLNISRQPDNGPRPRPDNRSGWLEGETPDLVTAALDEQPTAELDVRLWDPATQLRLERKGNVPRRPDGAANTGHGRATREGTAREAAA